MSLFILLLARSRPRLYCRRRPRRINIDDYYGGYTSQQIHHHPASTLPSMLCFSSSSSFSSTLVSPSSPSPTPLPPSISGNNLETTTQQQNASLSTTTTAALTKTSNNSSNDAAFSMFSPSSELFLSSSSVSSSSLVGRMWEDTTTRILNPEQTPIGAMTIIQWQLTETLILYWSTIITTTTTPAARAAATSTGSTDVPSTPVTPHPRDKPLQTTLALINRLAEERTIAYSCNTNSNIRNTNNDNTTTNTTTNSDNNNDRTSYNSSNTNNSTITDTKRFFKYGKEEGEDFRVIDISLIHAMLKQWKACTKQYLKKTHQQQQQQHRRSSRSRSSSSRNTTTTTNNNNNNNNNNTDTDTSSVLLLPTPSEMLQQVDDWVVQTPRQITGKPHQESERNSCFFEPNIATYTIIMDTAAATIVPSSSSSSSKQTGKSSELTIHNEGIVHFIETLFRRLIDDSSSSSSMKPTIVTIGIVLRALANTRTMQNAEKAEAWLRYLQQQQPNTTNNNDDDKNDGGNDDDDVLLPKPNTVLYTTVIKAWSDLGQYEQAESLLREMYQDYMVNGNTAIKPTSYTFNTVLGSYAKALTASSTTTDRSSSTLAFYTHEEYYALIQKAEELIQIMKDISSSPPSKPPSLIGSGRSNKHNNNNNHNTDDDASPTIISYNSLLSTIARCCDHDYRRRRHHHYHQKYRSNVQDEQLRKFQSGDGNADDSTNSTCSSSNNDKSTHNDTFNNDNSDHNSVPPDNEPIDLLPKAEYWMEEILNFSANGNTSSSSSNNEIVTTQTQQQRHQKSGDRTRDRIRNNGLIVRPDLITYKVLFNIISSSNSRKIDGTKKKEKATYWLSRSNDPKLINDPLLLRQIRSMN